MTQHSNSATHRQNLQKLIEKVSSGQQFISQSLNKANSQTEKQKNFNKKLCKTLVESNIPLYKMSHSIKAFFQEFTAYETPNESTLRKNYLPLLYEEKMSEIRDKKIWVSINETSDKKGRYIANVIVGTLEDNAKRYLINCSQLEKVKFNTIALMVNKSLSELYDKNIKKDNVLLFITDGAPNMKKAYKNGLKGFYPKMLHITCMAHGLHRVCESIRTQFKDIDNLIANVKSIYKKYPYRVNQFKQMAPELSLPPKPIITRWATWIEAAIYYAKNFEIIEKIINCLNPEEAASINRAQKILKKNKLKENLVYINANFSFIQRIIKCLEGKIPLFESIRVISQVKENFEQLDGKIGNIIKEKFNQVLNKNSGFEIMLKINDLINNNSGHLEDIKIDYSIDEISCFKYAAITSCDVERSFSKYKSVLSDRREGFTVENLKCVLILNCNI
jgi:hypothetical protein